MGGWRGLQKKFKGKVLETSRAKPCPALLLLMLTFSFKQWELSPSLDIGDVVRTGLGNTVSTGLVVISSATGRDDLVEHCSTGEYNGWLQSEVCDWFLVRGFLL